MPAASTTSTRYGATMPGWSIASAAAISPEVAIPLNSTSRCSRIGRTSPAERDPRQESARRIMPNKVVNDFSITVGTVNGSGSQTANTTILRALFKMGVPVSGKNLFPSNIQGQPTWYTIRLNKDGFIARRDEQEIVVAMNPSSFARDLAGVLPGGAFFYADDIKQPITRTDITVYPMPVKQIVRSDGSIPSDFRDLVGNMVYVGVLAQTLGIDLDKIRAALEFHFKGKQKPIDMNFNTVKAGAEWARANLEKRDPFTVEPMSKT